MKIRCLTRHQVTDWLTDLGSPSPCGPAMCEWTDIISGILSWLHSAGNFLCMTEWFHYETRHILGAESLSHSWVDTGYEEGTGGPERRLEGLWQYKGWTARLWCAWRAGTKPGFAQTTGESVRTRTFGHSLSKTDKGVFTLQEKHIHWVSWPPMLHVTWLLSASAGFRSHFITSCDFNKYVDQGISQWTQTVVNLCHLDLLLVT